LFALSVFNAGEVSANGFGRKRFRRQDLPGSHTGNFGFAAQQGGGEKACVSPVRATYGGAFLV